MTFRCGCERTPDNLRAAGNGTFRCRRCCNARARARRARITAGTYAKLDEVGKLRLSMLAGDLIAAAKLERLTL